MAEVRIGTSGWNYDWPELYEGWAKKRRLEGYAARFDAVEVNGTFYRLQSASTFEGWRERTPEDFRFAVKANRYLTHNKSLAEGEEPVRRERESATHLDDKLGPVLWQLPKRFARDDERLAAWLEALQADWASARHVLEPRHESWFDDEVAARLGEAGVAFCMSDAPDWPLWRTPNTDLVYARLHGHTRLYRSRYASRTLDGWAEDITRYEGEGRDVFVFFDNTEEGHAPRDAARLLQRL